MMLDVPSGILQVEGGKLVTDGDTLVDVSRHRATTCTVVVSEDKKC